MRCKLVERLAHVPERRRRARRAPTGSPHARAPSPRTTPRARPRATATAAPSRSIAAAPRSRAPSASRRSSRDRTHVRKLSHHDADDSASPRAGVFHILLPAGCTGLSRLGVLSIAKLRVGQEAYQLSGVAQSLDDYYTGAGEAQRRVGRRRRRPARPRRRGRPPTICAPCSPGCGPGTGGLTPNGDTIRPHPRRVPGFDLTFKAPKSASVLYAVSDDPRVQGAVIEAGEAAMRAAVGWLEREAIQVRRGSHNLACLARLDAGDRGRRARAGWRPRGWWRRRSGIAPPAPVTRCCTGTCWSPTWPRAPTAGGRRSSTPTCTGTPRAAGEVFQAAFRDELTRRSGSSGGPAVTSPRSPASPSRCWTRSRSGPHEIEAWLAATGTPDTPEGRQAAVLATRRQQARSGARTVRRRLEGRSRTLGWGPATAERSDRRQRPPQPGRLRRRRGGSRPSASTSTADAEHFERIVDPEEWIADLLRRDLTVDRSTFTHADLTEAVAARLGARRHGRDDRTARPPRPRLDRRSSPSAHRRRAGAVDQPRAARRRSTASSPPSTAPARTARPATPSRPRSRPAPTSATTSAPPSHAICATDAAGGGAGRPGRDRQDLHPRRRPRRLRRRRHPGHRRRPVGPGRARARRRRRHAGHAPCTALARPSTAASTARTPGTLLVIDEAGMADIRTLDARRHPPRRRRRPGAARRRPPPAPRGRRRRRVRLRRPPRRTASPS